MEVMSSVLHEICEMFNGSGIVRTLGRPMMAQIIIFQDEYDRLEKNLDDDD